MRRVEPAFPDLFPVTHMLRPGYLPQPTVTLDPVRMAIVWQDAPHRQLPTQTTLPRGPVRSLVFGATGRARPEAVRALVEGGSSVLVVLDDPALAPADIGLDGVASDGRVTALLPMLPTPLAAEMPLPTAWAGHRWGTLLGLFPFAGAGDEVESRLERLRAAGASFALAAPLLLTPKDRHRILDAAEGCALADQLENALFHADVGRGLHALERRAGVAMHALGMEPVIPPMAPSGCHPEAAHTAALLRLWARRLDQSYEESSWGWRLRRAAAALEPLQRDPRALDAEGNLRVIPGFDDWVASFTRCLWRGGGPVAKAWAIWSAGDGAT